MHCVTAQHGDGMNAWHRLSKLPSLATAWSSLASWLPLNTCAAPSKDSSATPRCVAARSWVVHYAMVFSHGVSVHATLQTSAARLQNIRRSLEVLRKKKVCSLLPPWWWCHEQS